MRYAERGNDQIEISNLTPDPVGAAGAVRQPGPRSHDSGGSGAPWVSDTPLRCRRDLRRLPQERRQDGELRSLLILILISISVLLLSARRFRRHKLRLWQAERRYCVGGSATWMSR
jgi:hypothetical protein